MGKNKKRNRWNSQPRKQENPLAQQQKMVAPKAVRDYWANNLTPDEQQIFNTPIAVAQQAGVMQRLGYLTAAFLHIHSVQSLLFGEMQNIVEDWGIAHQGSAARHQFPAEQRGQILQRHARPCEKPEYRHQGDLYPGRGRIVRQNHTMGRNPKGLEAWRRTEAGGQSENGRHHRQLEAGSLEAEGAGHGARAKGGSENLLRHR